MEMSLRDFIDHRDEINTVKIQTFCRLMKKVSAALEAEERNVININLDDIKINKENGSIVLPDNMFVDLDKTISGMNTGISVMADRKSSKENKRVAFALMLLGWYVNDDGSAILNDMQVLENFDVYMNKVPVWLQEYFINIFKKMNYDMSFNEYYNKHFIERIKKDINEAFAPYDLSKEQMDKVSTLVARVTNRMVKEGI